MRHLARTVLARARVHTAHGRSPSGAPLPPLAFRMGGEHFRSDAAFVSSAVREVERLEEAAELSVGSRLLDWGCGAGRLAVGVVERYGRLSEYHGVDVQLPLIRWAAKHLGPRPGFRFTHVDLANSRYNPAGRAVQTIPGESGTYDVFYAYSVFSHLLEDDTRAYLKEVARLLSPGGRAFVTAFVEDVVEDVVENPEGYGPFDWSGPLHCVRYRREFFEELAESAGLRVEQHKHGQETDGQSLYVFVRPEGVSG